MYGDGIGKKPYIEKNKGERVETKVNVHAVGAGLGSKPSARQESVAAPCGCYFNK